MGCKELDTTQRLNNNNFDDLKEFKAKKRVLTRNQSASTLIFELQKHKKIKATLSVISGDGSPS